MDIILLVGGLFFVAMIFLRAFLTPPPPHIIYVEAKPPSAPQAQTGGGLGCLLWLVILVVGLMLMAPA